MKYLLDTHVFIWLVMFPERLSPFAQRTLELLGNEVYLSAASVWEIAQKRAAGRLAFDGDVVTVRERHNVRELPIRGVHCEAAASLPRHHKDPFDRLLVAQARVEGFVLVTHDEVIGRYDVPLLQV